MDRELILHKQTLNQIATMERSVIKALEEVVKFIDGKTTKTEVVNQLTQIGTPDALKVAEAVKQMHTTLKAHKNTDLTEVTSLLKQAVKELSKPAKEIKIPEQKDTVKVSNLKDIDFATLEKAIKGIVLDPKIDVKSPEVTVNTDLEPVKKGLTDVVKAIKNIAYPEIPKTDLAKLEAEAKESNKKLDQANKHLETITKIRGGSGGGGTGTSFKNAAGNLAYVDLESDGSVPVTVVAGGSGGGLTDAELRATPVPVSGTVAATQSGTWTEANSAAIKTAVETIDNAISGSEMQVDVVGALPAGTNAIGKLAANSGVDIGDVDVTSAVSSTLDHGSNLDIDTSAEQITSTSFACKFGVTLKAAATNTGTLYIGDSSSVTAGTTGSTDGFPLEPGESVTLPVNNPNLLYAIASVANQKIFWVAT